MTISKSFGSDVSALLCHQTCRSLFIIGLVAIAATCEGQSQTAETQSTAADLHQRFVGADSDLQRTQNNILNVMSGSYQTDVAIPGPRSEREGLFLRVEIDKRPYLLGEPILVRAALANETREAITVPYDYWTAGTNAKILFHLTAPDGSDVDRLHHIGSLKSPGPPAVVIQPGQQFMQTIDLRFDYGIVNPGEYKLTAEYNSNGKYLESDPETRTRIPKTGWAGQLTVDLGTLVVQSPTTAVDRAALNELLEWQQRVFPVSESARYALLYDVIYLDDESARAFIERHSKSRYADFVRLHSAIFQIDCFRRSEATEFGQQAIDLLQSIDRRTTSFAIKEWVLYQLIQMQRDLGKSDTELKPLTAEFEKQFPESPYIRSSVLQQK